MKDLQCNQGRQFVILSHILVVGEGVIPCFLLFSACTMYVSKVLVEEVEPKEKRGRIFSSNPDTPLVAIIVYKMNIKCQCRLMKASQGP